MIQDKTPSMLCIALAAVAANWTNDWRWWWFAAFGVAILFYKPKQNKKDLSRIFRETGAVKKTGTGEELPVVMKTEEQETGFKAVLSLPVGLSSHDLQKRSNAIGEALNANVSFEYNNGVTIMTADRSKLKKFYKYEPMEFKGAVEIPIGHTKQDFASIKLSDEYSSILIGGLSGYGKSALIRQILVSLITRQDIKKPPNIILHLIDLKYGVEFDVFRKCSMVDSFEIEEEDVIKVVNKLEKMVKERYLMFRSEGLVKINNYNKKFDPIPYHVLVVDEFASLNQYPETLSKLIHLARICRGAGVFCIFATQYPTAEAIPSALKFNCQCRIAFKVITGVNSRVILDLNGAEDLPCPGRALMLSNKLQEIQVPFLDEDEARELIKHTYIKPNSTPKIKKQKGVLTLDDWQKSKNP